MLHDPGGPGLLYGDEAAESKAAPRLARIDVSTARHSRAGGASALLGLTAHMQGRWQDLFKDEFVTWIRRTPASAVDVDDFSVSPHEFDELIWPVLAKRVPAFEAIKVVNAWAGHYDYCVLDNNAIVGPHPEVQNFLFANRFTGHGLQQSPAIGRALAEFIVSGSYRTLDLSPLSYDRIAEDRPFMEDAVV